MIIKLKIIKSVFKKKNIFVCIYLYIIMIVFHIGFIKINCESRATFSWVSKYLFQSSNLWGFILVGILQLKHVFTRLCNGDLFLVYSLSLSFSLSLQLLLRWKSFPLRASSERETPSVSPAPLTATHCECTRECVFFFGKVACGRFWWMWKRVKASVKFSFYMCFKS